MTAIITAKSIKVTQMQLEMNIPPFLPYCMSSGVWDSYARNCCRLVERVMFLIHSETITTLNKSIRTLR